MYRELNVPNVIVSDAANLIRSNTGVNERIAVTFVPPDMWNRQKDTGKTMAEGFMIGGIGIVKADNNRVQGWLQVKEMLADMPDGKPGLLIFNTCKDTIGDLQAYTGRREKPERLRKTPRNHTPLFVWRYAYCNRRRKH